MSARRRIFLAHAREDKPRVRKLYADLKARGFDPWLDEVDLMPGQIWKTEIPNAIRYAEMFLACLSRQSIEKRGYVQREFRQALSAFAERPPGSIYVIPVRLDDCDVPDLDIPDLELNLRDIQWVDLWQEGGLARLVAAIEHALGERIESLPEPGTELRDAPWCPELVVVPAGAFMMSSTEPERRWAIGQGAKREWVDWEKPQHRVVIPERFAVGKYAVTRGQFARFVEATGHDMSGGCWIWTEDKWEQSPTADWCAPGFEQTDDHPAVGVSWDDAKAYVEWLGRETGSRIACCPRRSGSMRAGRGRRPATRGAMSRRRRSRPTSAETRVGPLRSARTRRTPWAVRHAWQRRRVGRGLLERELCRRPERRQRLDHGRL